MQTLHVQNLDELKARIEEIATLSWIALPGFDLLKRQARHNYDPDWQFAINLKHHGPGLTTIGPLLKRLQAPDGCEDVQKIESALINMVMRAIVADTFEAIQAYCRDYDHEDHLKNQKWYYFFKTIRNTFSHGGTVIVFSEKEKVLRSEWQQKRFDEAMFGFPISQDFFDFDDAQLFIDDMTRFCDELQERENKSKGE